MKTGEVVTVDLGEISSSSNTYLVLSVTEQGALVYHPMAPEVFLEKKNEILNKVGAKPKDSLERCLDFANKYKKHLKYYDVCELEALCFFFVIRKFFAPMQKERLSAICEKIARVYCNSTLHIAYKVLKENKPIIIDDEFNARFYRSHEKFILGKSQVLSPRNESCIYRMVGFALAQVETP